MRNLHSDSRIQFCKVLLTVLLRLESSSYSCSAIWQGDKRKVVLVSISISSKSTVPFGGRRVGSVKQQFFFSYSRNTCRGQNELSKPRPWLSPLGTFHISIGKFSNFVIRFFLSLTFPISLSDFAIELLSKNLITK